MSVIQHLLDTKDLGSVSLYGDAREGGYQGTKAQFMGLVNAILNGAMLISVGKRVVSLEAADWDNDEYDLSDDFPTNRYRILDIMMDGDHINNAGVTAWYNADITFDAENVLTARAVVPQVDIPIVVIYESMLAAIEVPVYTGSLTYNGQVQTPTFTGYDPDTMTMSGDTYGTNAGTYTTTFTPAYGYKWIDGTKAPKNISWTIAKQTQTIPLSAYTVDLPNAGDTATVTISGSYTGLTVSSDSQLASASISGNTITIARQGSDKGNATITVQTNDYPNVFYTAEIAAVCGTIIYGVYWDGGTSPVMTRTDDSELFTDPVAAVDNGDGSSPFDTLYPWSCMQIVEDADVGTLVSIPKFYYKWTRSGSTMKLQISPTQFTGSYVSPLHADRGDGQGVRDVAYVGRYHCDANYKSESGESIYQSSRATFRTSIHNLGSDVWQYDYAAYWTIRMLYLVEYANWNAWTTIGACSTSTATNGATDNMIYHTGTTAADRSTTNGNIQYRHIEDIYCGRYEFVDGIYLSGSTVYCIKNPASFSDTTGGTSTGSRYTTTSYTGIRAFNNPSASGFEYALYPSANTSSYTQYICGQQYGSGTGKPALICAVRLFNYESVASTYAYGVGRLMKLPNAS